MTTKTLLSSAIIGMIVAGCASEVGSDLSETSAGDAKGAITLNDVAILFPLERDAKDALLRPNSTIVNGRLVRSGDENDPRALLPRSVYESLINDENYEDDAAEPVSFADYRVVAARIDPCGRRVPTDACAYQIRFSLQEVVQKPGWYARTPIDAALHVFYEVSKTDMVELLQKVVSLKKQRAATADMNGAVRPHPIMKEELTARRFGDDTFTTSFETLLLQVALRGKLTELGRIDQSGRGHVQLKENTPTHRNLERAGGCDLNQDDVGAYFWTFHGGRVTNGAVSQSGTQFVYGNADMTDPAKRFVFYGTLCPTPTESDVTAKPGEKRDNLPYTDEGPTPPSFTDVAEATTYYERSMRVQNPTVHFRGQTSCANCHFSEGMRIRSRLYLMNAGKSDVVDRIDTTLGLRGAPRTRFGGNWYMRAFGYAVPYDVHDVPATPAIMQRVVNDATLSASAANELLK